MDVNAGAYLDGIPMEALGQDMFDLTLGIAGVEQSVGEMAGTFSGLNLAKLAPSSYSRFEVSVAERSSRW